jgi:predicted Fe-Mo cluster-binding NifX family protein
MKIAVATNKKGSLEDEVAPHFGRAKNYLIYDTETKNFVVEPNPEVTGGKLLPPDFLSQKGVGVVIAFSLGFKAYEKFKNYNIEMYKAIEKNISSNIKAFENNQLRKLSEEDIF